MRAGLALISRDELTSIYKAKSVHKLQTGTQKFEVCHNYYVFRHVCVRTRNWNAGEAAAGSIDV